MTEVAPGCPGTALAPPHTAPTASRNASPCRSASDHGSPSGTRRQLAKDKREEDEKAQELLEALRDKERRAQQQLDRCAEERGRKMEEQRRKEQKRRAAAEEKRRQQQEAEKERLEALVRKRAGGNERRGGGGGGGGGETRDHLEHRPKRWTWGGPPDGVEVGDFLSPPAMDPPVSKELSSSSSAIHSSERVSFVSHRTASPKDHKTYRSSSNRRSTAGFPEETSRAKTPTGEFPNAPARSSSFRSNSKGPATPKRVRSTRSPAQSPCSPGQYPPSPLRQRATTPSVEDRGHAELKGHSSLERKTKSETSEKKMPKSSSKELTADSPVTATGRSAAGTTDAEEASRLLAERRRLARIQKEQEERERQEEERLRAEEEQRRLQEARERQERAAQQAEEERVRQEEERRTREDEERRQKEQRWKDMQDQLDKEREEAFLRAQREAERKRQERELLHIQEEQERLQRKKRIEEIMKRTRKSEVEPLPTAGADTRTDLIVHPEEEAGSPAEAPVITLGSLETKSCVDELSDGVQSMDVSSPSVSISPVSREEQASAQDFSPVMEEHVLDLEAPGRHSTQTPTYPKVQASSGVGDLNKNLLIQACSAESSQLMCSVGPSKLDVQ
ncbi:MAP7 domain-containing protein 2-like isoform X4 [Takifugu flavidus]|uniref:MAP7 domain-containing protein 2-like isoform X4 n=1 Tax=Takifugu flavidus TaxID=433684 RepID=UPI002544796B|nr:MAP7 domain-containing protein 2-like isoform X4 [Takifugu flavidus]